MDIFTNRKVGYLATTIIISFSSVSPAYASMEQFWEKTAGIESGADGYNAMSSTSSALGRYQITAANWKASGILENYNGSWEKATFTDKARSMGINSYTDLLANKGVQDAQASSMAIENWKNVSSAAKRQIGTKMPNGTVLNEAMVSRAAWFLGPSTASKLIESGFDPEVIREADKNGRILASNAGDTYEQFVEYAMGGMEKFKDTDISDLTGGGYGKDGKMSKIEEDLTDCDEDIAEMITNVAKQNVENTTAMAQHPVLGISQMEKGFSEMSCIDFAFSGGGLQALFKVPNFGDLQGMISDFACSTLKQMTGQLNNQVNAALTDMTAGLSQSVGGFGPISNLGGVQVGWNPNAKEGFSYGMQDSNIQYKIGDFSYGGGTGPITSGGGFNSGSINGLDTLTGEVNKIGTVMNQGFNSLFAR